jgi:hypothetical protein
MTTNKRSETDIDKPTPEGVRKSRPARERRSADRIADDQRSGEGAQSAMSRLRMVERKRAQALATDWRKELDE